MAKLVRRFTFGRQSSMAPDRTSQRSIDSEDSIDPSIEVEPDDRTIQLLYYASKGDVQNVRCLLDGGLDVNAADFDDRTALHLAACEGQTQVADLLISKGANVNAQDRWGSTPLADAKHYENDAIHKLLAEHGAKYPDSGRSPVLQSELIADYEVNPLELDFEEKEGDLFPKWRGTKVCIKKLPIDKNWDRQRVITFLNELDLMLKLRHPNVVQFLGAVTRSSPMMIITEYLPGGSLRQFLKDYGGPLKPSRALKFALDVARGLSYVHEWKPEPIIHRKLKPSNLLRDKAGHLKITDFAFRKSLGVVMDQKNHKVQFKGSFCRYMAPEILLQKEYDKTVDVFSFGLILFEMMEGNKPFEDESPEAAAKAYSEEKRPPFKIKSRYYPVGLRELIQDCWHHDPAERPQFGDIIKRIEGIRNSYDKNAFKQFLAQVKYGKSKQ